MDFEPTIVYKPAGPHQRQGGTFDYKGVSTQEELDAAIADGWDESFAEMLEPKAKIVEAPEPEPEPEPANDAAPTRAELEQKATELGLKFDGRTSDKKLGEMIAKALKGQA